MNLKFTLLLAACAATLHAQVITAVLNDASLDTRISPGALAIVRGTNLGVETSVPVTVGGKYAAVRFASLTQFSIQIPFDAPTGATTIQVGNSAAFSITLSQFAPALYTANQTGSGNASALHSDGRPITVLSPAAPGETISLYATGLGATVPALGTGVPGPANPPSRTAVQPTVVVGSEPATVLSSTVMPGEIGIYQVVVRLSSEPITGIRTILLSIGGASSGFNVSLPVGVAPAIPAISNVISATGIAESVQSNIQAGSWVAIYGTNLSNVTRDWTGEISGGRLPTVLGGVSVTIDSKPAAIYFVSPGQINVQAPDTGASGSVQVLVNNGSLSSAAVTAQMRTHAPALFQWGATKYAVATRYPDNSNIGGPSLGAAWAGAKPGDILILWGTGFGPTQPASPAGVTTPVAAPTASPVTVTVGGVEAIVLGSALSPGLAGVYQIAIQVPAGAPLGDALVKASIAGFQTPDNVYLYLSSN